MTSCYNVLHTDCRFQETQITGASSCVWDGLNFCPISGMLWDGVQVVLSVWLQVPSLRVTSNDVRPLRLSASENKAPEIKRGWETLTVLWPGIRCLQGVWPCVTVVTWRRDKARDTWHSLRSQLAASFLSDLRAHVSVTNLVKKAEAEQSLDCNNISASQLPEAHTDPSLSLLSLQSIYLTPLFDSPSLPLNSDSRWEFKCPYLMIRSITSRSI